MNEYARAALWLTVGYGCGEAIRILEHPEPRPHALAAGFVLFGAGLLLGAYAIVRHRPSISSEQRTALIAWWLWYRARMRVIANPDSGADYTGYEQDLFEAFWTSFDAKLPEPQQ
jgi:hypothetical protein